MTFHRFVRRLHLYLGLFLLPWFLLYGISSVLFSHGRYFEGLYNDGKPNWTVRFDRPYRIEIPASADQRAAGERILRDAGLKGAFGTYRPNGREFHVYVYDFWSATQLKYYADRGRLVAEDRRFRLDHMLTGMHARSGFTQSSFLDDAWAVTVDLACLGMIAWIASGLYMWWKLSQTRAWGALALAGGATHFALFLLVL